MTKCPEEEYKKTLSKQGQDLTFLTFFDFIYLISETSTMVSVSIKIWVALICLTGASERASERVSECFMSVSESASWAFQ